MNPHPHQDDGSTDQSVGELVNEYFDRRQAGEALTPEQFAAEHPELAEELRPYLEGLALIDRARSAAGTEDTALPPVLEGVLPPITGYKLLEEIGRGGMGVVYRALQVSTKRTVAVKVLLAGPFASDMARQRFAREVELAARLDHPGIVRILESGAVAGQPYYAMDYVDGVRLDRLLAGAGPDLSDLLKLFVQICQTVDGAHRHGVVHRDLKPANVLIDKEGKPHILDFGLAKAIDQAGEGQTSYRTLSSPGQVMGTLAYLSPEQAAGTSAEVDARTDVYALGVMLFEALTGKLPVDPCGRPSDVIQRILEAPPTPPTRLSPRVDGELETIILKALAKEKTGRYASARELSDDLCRYLNGEPILARRPSSFYVVRKKLLKYRVRIAVGAAVVVLGLVGLWAGTQWSRRARVERAARELAQARREALRVQQVLDVGDVQTARSAAESVLARYPELPEGPLILAQTLFHAREADQAIVKLERVPPTRSGAWAARALRAEVYRSVGDAQRADRLAAEAQQGMPDTADGWYLRSLATLNAADAASFAEEALHRDARHVLGWSRLAHLHIGLGRLDDALRAAEQLVALEPAAIYWKTLKGDILVRRREFERALAAYTDVMRLHAGPDLPYDRRAIAYRRLKRYDDAIADYDRVLALEDKYPGTVPIWHRYQRATCAWMAGRPAEAADDYRRVRAVVGRPHYSDARLALILRELGRDDEAAAVLQAALRDVDDPWLAKILAGLSDRLPVEDFVQAAGADNAERQCEAYYYAGEACLWRGERAQARGWFERCVQTGVEFDPDNFNLTPMSEYELAAWRLETLGKDADDDGGGLPR